MLKDLIKKIWNNKNDYKERYKEEYQARKIDRILTERERNANERELLRFKEEERQKMIKAELDRYRKKQKNEYWKSKPINTGWNSLKSKDNILHSKKIFENKSTILKGDIKNHVK